MRKNIYLFFILCFLTGCSATYELELGGNRSVENLTIYSSDVSENEYIDEKFYPVYYGSEINTINPYEKLSGTLYYNSSLLKKDVLNILNYNYVYKDSSYKLSNIINNTFDDVVIQRYDHDGDGKEDYLLISTSDTFSWFNIEEKLEKVTIKIKSHYKVISSNADLVNKNELVWYFTPDNIKAINLVCDPSKIIDDRTFLQKFLDGEYINIFSVSIFGVFICLVLYLIFKKKGSLENRI